MKLRTAIMYYIACLLSTAILFAIVMKIKPNNDILLGAILTIYLASGIFLNIKVLKNLVTYSEYHGTINNIFADKIRTILFWIFSYPWLFIKLAVVKIL